MNDDSSDIREKGPSLAQEEEEEKTVKTSRKSGQRTGHFLM